MIYLDESGFAVDSPRTHGYSLKGVRCYDFHDWHKKGRINAIGALIKNKLLTATLFNCNIDSDIFYAWLTKDLLPKLTNNSVIVMDNAKFHKRNDMIQIIQDAGHLSLFLPPYSPDLNPIEKKWAEIKAIRKQLRCSPFEVFLHINYYGNL